MFSELAKYAEFTKLNLHNEVKVGFVIRTMSYTGGGGEVNKQLRFEFVFKFTLF